MPTCAQSSKALGIDPRVADHRGHEAADDAQLVGEVTQGAGERAAGRDDLRGLLGAVARGRLRPVRHPPRDRGTAIGSR